MCIQRPYELVSSTGIRGVGLRKEMSVDRGGVVEREGENGVGEGMAELAILAAAQGRRQWLRAAAAALWQQL